MKTRLEVRAALEHALADLSPAPAYAAMLDEVIVQLRPETILEACRRAKYHPDLSYDYLRCVSGVDYQQEGLEVVYHLFSTRLLQKSTFKVRVPQDNPVLPSVTSVWAGANWHEREAMELFGLVFEGHPHPEPLLLQKDEDNRIVPGHILLKSFPLRPKEFPME